MGEFVDSVYDIYCFSKEKIEKELHIILDYYLNDLDNFDVLNIDLVDQAKTFVERKTKRENQMKEQDPEHKRIVEEILENHRKNRSSILAKDENVMTDTEKEVKQLIEKFNIIINRQYLSVESKKGYNKCKDNNLAFIQHKKGTLFPKKGVVEQYEIEKERKEALDDLNHRIKLIEEDEPHRKEVYDYAYA